MYYPESISFLLASQSESMRVEASTGCTSCIFCTTRHNTSYASKETEAYRQNRVIPSLHCPGNPLDRITYVGGVIINVVAGTGNLLLGYHLVFGAAALFFLLAAIGMLFVKK